MPKAQTIENLKEIVDQISEIYSYSGRGMYGNKCLAFTISGEASGAGVVASIIRDYTFEFGDATLDEVVTLFERSKTDSMGRDSVMYFPSIEWNEDWEEKDDEELCDDCGEPLDNCMCEGSEDK